MAHGPARRVLIAGVGNVLRRDDGFGPAVVGRLRDLPPGVEVIETGIGGMSLLQELLASAWDGLVVVDAVDRAAAPGTVFVIEPDIAPREHVPDTHLANPDRVLMIAQAMGALPARVVLVGCQPGIVEPTGEPLTPAVERAVGVAAAEVAGVVAEWMDDPGPEVSLSPTANERSERLMGHSEHQDENSADAAMANPEAISEERETVEEQPEAAKGGPEEAAGEE